MKCKECDEDDGYVHGDGYICVGKDVVWDYMNGELR